jgi:hypothetical protein
MSGSVREGRTLSDSSTCMAQRCRRAAVSRVHTWLWKHHHQRMKLGMAVQAAYAELQQHAGSQEQELTMLRSARSPGRDGSGPHSGDGSASSRLREMHGQLAQQDSQLASIRAENQVRCHSNACRAQSCSLGCTAEPLQSMLLHLLPDWGAKCSPSV